MNKLLILALLIGGCGNDSSSPLETTDSDNKTEALNFSLQIIESIIDQDVATYKTFFLDSVWLMDGDGPISLSEGMIEEIFSGILYSSAIDTNTTMDDYHSNFTPTIYTFDEYNDLFINGYMQPFEWLTLNDFVYVGIPFENSISRQ